MKRMRLCGLAVMGLLMGCATASPPQTPAASTQEARKDTPAATGASQDSDNTLVCEEVMVTGSHIPQRTCRTRRQIKQEQEQAQKLLQHPKPTAERIGN